MKKLFLLIAIVAMVLPSCKKINEELDALGNRINKLEQETIPTIDEQIAAINTTLGNLDAMDKELKSYIDHLTATASNLQEQINGVNTKIGEVKAELKGDIASTNSELKGEIVTAKADVLAQLEASETELKNELAQINATIETLKAKDAELDKKIADLRTYVDTELGKTTDWANATFATLEQYNALVSEVATIKEQIKAINQSITDLETRLATKVNEDIAKAVSTLNADIQQKVKEITDAYTNAIKSAKEEITAAYTTAIQNAINALDSSLKSWVGEQLSNYYTIAQIDAMLATMEQEMNGKLEAQKSYLEGLINELSAALTKNIADNKVLIDALREDITSLQGESTEHASKIAENATAIATNAQSIINNATAITQNGEDIEANEKLIADNKALIEANTKAIAENKSAIEALKSSTSTSIVKNATDITQNARNIAKNAALISQNATAIANNQLAISHNATDIAQLQQDLVTTKSEITEAYKKAISDAITTNNGVIDTKIAAEVNTINTRIDNEVSTINSAIETLASRITAVENEIITIQQQIANMLAEIDDIKEDISKLLARIQSISYIPTYDDGKATVKYADEISRVTLDFEISPKDAVVELAKVWQSAVSVKAIYTQTRAVSFIDMPIVKFEADATNGVISVTASGENLSAEFFNGTQSASVRLSISDGNNSITSDYVPVYSPTPITTDSTNFVVSNIETLKQFATGIYQQKVYFTEDIAWPAEEPWTPIEGYTGEVYGLGHKITGLNAPLFGKTQVMLVDDLHLENVNIEDGTRLQLGALACEMSAATLNVSNCSVSGKMSTGFAGTTGPLRIGGLIGYASGTGTFSNLRSSINITSTSQANIQGNYAGIVSYPANVFMQDCQFTGSIILDENIQHSDVNMAGITNLTTKSLVRCINGDENNPEAGKLSCEATVSTFIFIGGIYSGTSKSIKLSDPEGINGCINYAPIHVGGQLTGTSYAYVGGIAGFMHRVTTQVVNCENHGDIEIALQVTNAGDTNAKQFAGIGPLNLASIQTVENCTNYGDITILEEASFNQAPIRVGGVISTTTTHSKGVKFNNLENYGNIYVESKVNNLTNSYIGGVVGMVVANTELTNSKSVCNIAAVDYTNVGMITGSARDTAAPNVKNCAVGGSICTSMTGQGEAQRPVVNELNATNYFKYIYSSADWDGVEGYDGCTFDSTDVVFPEW